MENGGVRHMTRRSRPIANSPPTLKTRSVQGRSRTKMLICSTRQVTPASGPVSTVSISDTQLASMTAGILSRILLHPIDCIKTRLQHFRSHASSTEPSKALLRFIATEKIAGLYRGISGAMLGVIPYSLLYMPSYEFAQQQLSSQLGQKELLGFRHVLAGSFAGLCGSLVKVPIDVIKKRTQAGLYPNAIMAVMSVISESRAQHALRIPLVSNLGVFYAGWRSSILYDIPYNSIQFLVLENVKRCASSLRPDRKLTRTDNVFVGALTGMITSIITEPVRRILASSFPFLESPSKYLPIAIVHHVNSWMLSKQG